MSSRDCVCPFFAFVTATLDTLRTTSNVEGVNRLYRCLARKSRDRYRGSARASAAGARSCVVMRTGPLFIYPEVIPTTKQPDIRLNREMITVASRSPFEYTFKVTY